MRKVNLDLNFGLKAYAQFRRRSPKPKVVQQSFLLGAVKKEKSLYMSTILNKLGLTTDAVITQLNTECVKNADWPIGLKIPMRIVITGAKEYTISVLEPTNFEIINFLLAQRTKYKNRFLKPMSTKALLRILYKIALYKSIYTDERNLRAWIKSALNAFNSYNLFSKARIHDVFLGDFKDENAYRKRRRRQSHPLRTGYKRMLRRFANSP